MDMDIEHLNKNQIVLLTLLVSFVTSIATGIATVSLMENAPTDVTRVISRIIEKPIETITPGRTEVITREQTVVVNESEQIAKAISIITPSLVRIYSVPSRGDKNFEGFGVVVSAEGVVADRRIVRNRTNYVARLSDGTEFTAVASELDGEQGFFTLTSEEALPTLTPASFESFDKLSLGQTVVAVGGETSTRIAPGVISELLPATNEQEASRVRTTIDAAGFSLGVPLVTLEGTVVGMPEEIGSRMFLSLQERE